MTAAITITAAGDDDFDVFGDATTIELADRFDDVLAEPVVRSRELLALLAPDAIAIPPADCPAWELPEYEPTPADLSAVEFFDDMEIESHVGNAVVLTAYEQKRRELAALRNRVVIPVTAPVAELGRTA